MISDGLLIATFIFILFFLIILKSLNPPLCLSCCPVCGTCRPHVLASGPVLSALTTQGLSLFS